MNMCGQFAFRVSCSKYGNAAMLRSDRNRAAANPDGLARRSIKYVDSRGPLRPHSGIVG